MIETTKILQTDLLDLLFDGRNKLYGAYELRVKYNKRMIISVSIMIIFCLLVFLFFAFGSGSRKITEVIIGPDVVLDNAPEPKVEHPLPPPPKTPPPPVKTFKLTVPIITTEDIKPEDELHKTDDLDKAKIGNVNIPDGVDDPDLIRPKDDKTGVIVVPKKEEEDYEKTWISVQIESAYPGGIESWRRFLNKNLRYPEDAAEKEIEGTVIVQFVVDKAGIVSDVEAVSGPNELREEAVRVIKKSGQWTAAIQNGRQVKSYKKQPITFKLQ